MIEEWKPISNYPDYFVSNLGRVRNARTGRILKFRIAGGTTGGAYFQVTLSQDGKRKSFYAHRLVANAFIPKTNNTLEVNHIDGNHFNNNVDNLEWVTHTEN